jgi:hypothetical protein
LAQHTIFFKVNSPDFVFCAAYWWADPSLYLPGSQFSG